MLGAAALHPFESLGLAAGELVLDVAGRRVEISAGDAEALRRRAAAHAGVSSTARDLSLLLARARTRPRVIALRRAEAQRLAAIAGELDLHELARTLTAKT